MDRPILAYPVNQNLSWLSSGRRCPDLLRIPTEREEKSEKGDGRKVLFLVQVLMHDHRMKAAATAEPRFGTTATFQKRAQKPQTYQKPSHIPVGTITNISLVVSKHFAAKRPSPQKL